LRRMLAIAVAIPRGIRPDQRAIAPHADPYLIHLSSILKRNPDPDRFVARFALMRQDPPVLVYCLQCSCEGHTFCLRGAGGCGQGTRVKKASGVFPSAR